MKNSMILLFKSLCFISIFFKRRTLNDFDFKNYCGLKHVPSNTPFFNLPALLKVPTTQVLTNILLFVP
jgi:hypothetical protein